VARGRRGWAADAPAAAAHTRPVAAELARGALSVLCCAVLCCAVLCCALLHASLKEVSFPANCSACRGKEAALCVQSRSTAIQLAGCASPQHSACLQACYLAQPHVGCHHGRLCGLCVQFDGQGRLWVCGRAQSEVSGPIKLGVAVPATREASGVVRKTLVASPSEYPVTPSGGIG
jgi:hypothetical protein